MTVVNHSGYQGKSPYRSSLSSGAHGITRGETLRSKSLSMYREPDRPILNELHGHDLLQLKVIDVFDGETQEAFASPKSRDSTQSVTVSRNQKARH